MAIDNMANKSDSGKGSDRPSPHFTSNMDDFNIEDSLRTQTSVTRVVYVFSNVARIRRQC